MNLLSASIVNEGVKLLSRKKTIFFLTLTAALPFLIMPLIRQLQRGLGITGVDGADYPLAVLGMLTAFVLPLLIFMSAADMFAGERGDRTIRSTLVRHVSRFTVLTAKLLTLFLLALAALLLGLTASIIASLFIPAAEGVTSGLADAALAYAVAAVPMFALSTIAVFIALIFKNASGALAIMILFYAAAKLSAFFFPQLAVLLPTSYMNWHELWIGSIVSISRITTVFSFLLGCGIVFYTMSYSLFDHQEV